VLGPQLGGVAYDLFSHGLPLALAVLISLIVPLPLGAWLRRRAGAGSRCRVMRIDPGPSLRARQSGTPDVVAGAPRSARGRVSGPENRDAVGPDLAPLDK
jgi:hypothetical protein